MPRRWRHWGEVYQPPTLGSITSLTSNPGAATYTFTGGYTPTSADAAVIVGDRTTQAVAETAFAMTVCGQAVIFPAAAHANPGAVAARAEPAIGYVRGLTVGVAGDVVFTHTSQTFSALIVHVVALAGWGGTVGGAGALQQSVASSTTLAPASLTVAHAGSLLLGASMALGTSALQPIAATGWAGQAETLQGSSMDGAFFSKTAGAAGGTETLSPVAAGAATVSGAAVLEFV